MIGKVNDKVYISRTTTLPEAAIFSYFRLIPFVQAWSSFHKGKSQVLGIAW